MPTISTFFGVTIRMFFSDHPPPHFHAAYQRPPGCHRHPIRRYHW